MWSAVAARGSAAQPRTSAIALEQEFEHVCIPFYLLEIFTMMKLKLLVAAVAIAVSGASQAAAFSNAGGQSGLIFEAWNGTTGYVEDLSATNSAALGDTWVATNGTAPASASFNLNSLFTTTFGSGAGLQWHVFSLSTGIGAPVLNTTLVQTSLPAGQTNSGLGTAMTASISHFGDIVSTLGAGVNFGTVGAASAAYPGPAGTFWGNITGNSAMSGFGSINFASLADLGPSALDPATYLSDIKSFTLASNGALTFTDTPAAVPLPAAVWLFGSGLLGLVGIGRRRKAA
jgi:hypothetical protein